MNVRAMPTQIHIDMRGHFSEIFRASAHDDNFLQDSVSFSRKVGTIRGLHTQVGPSAQTQLLTILSGRILDVIVEIGSGGPEISYNVMDFTENNQVRIPPRTLHGFVTLTENVVLLYKADRYFSPGLDAKVNPFDPELAVDWGISPELAIVGIADRTANSYSTFRTVNAVN